MPEGLVIQSHKGPYSVAFADDLLADCRQLLAGQPHFLVDANVARFYGDRLGSVFEHPHTLIIEATEENKSIERVIPVIERLVANKVRRDHILVAIGGGIIQDITCFIASTLMRGLTWKFVPTTLLAQADSCIGSKSSINLGATKNILGTFNPPKEIFICTDFLDTLEDKDIRSGIGEILKVHAIEGAAAFDRLAADYDALLDDRAVLLKYLRDALLIKQRFIEIDEFDKGVRNIFNYGHSFGHAIEAATQFAVPHGIAVTIGMDMANYVATRLERMSEDQFRRMHGVLRTNARGYTETVIPMPDFYAAIGKDKKNVANRLTLILPNEAAKIEKVVVDGDERFRSACQDYVDHVRRS